MGVSADGRICFGLLFDEGYEFPWDESEMDIDDWWRDQHDWKPSRPIYDEKGNHLPGVLDADVKAYYKERREWDIAHPLPVELVNYCSGDYAMYILAIPGTGKRASQGDPVVISPALDFVLKAKDRQAFLDFIQTHEIDPQAVPAWYLCSYRG